MIKITLNQIDKNKTCFETELKINHFDLNATCKLHKKYFCIVEAICLISTKSFVIFYFLNFCPYFATTTTKDTRILHAWKQFKHNLREFQVSCNISKSVIKDLLKFRSTIHKQNVLVILKLCNSIFNYLMVASLTKILYCLSCQQGIHQKTHYF